MQFRRLVLTLFCVIALMPQMISHAQQDRALRVTAQGERRVALIIGNSAYTQGALANPVNDARDIAAALRQANFEVLFGENQNRRQMRELIRQFGEKIRNGGVGLFYFAGHGVQVSNENYLLPIGAEITKETEIEDEGIRVGFVLAQMEEARNKLNIVILDACRDNPFARSFRSASERGLAVTRSAPTGTFIAYATGAGNVASDGAGRNGLFTQELLTNLKTPGLTLESVFRRTRTTVRSKSNGQQVPYDYSSVEGEDFYFLPPNGAMPPPVMTPAPVVSTAPPAIKPTNNVRMSVAGVPLAAMSFLTASVDANGNVTNQRQEQCYGFVEDLGGGVKLEMVEIPRGTFQMGASNSAIQEALANTRESNATVEWFSIEQPQHEVSLRGFAMSKYEITQAQWHAIMGSNPSRFKGDNLPVEQVSWEEAQEFCRKLSTLTRRKYRLPSEAEWEYAARAGTTSLFTSGGTISLSVVNYLGDSFGKSPGGIAPLKTVTAGTLPANRWGLYEIYGNVEEWCEDSWHDGFLGAPSDGSSWLSNGDSRQRVVRGGSNASPAWHCRTTHRNKFAFNDRIELIGFRVVVSAKTE